MHDSGPIWLALPFIVRGLHPLLLPVSRRTRVLSGPPRFLRANQKCNGSHDRTACAEPAARRTSWPPIHGRCASDLFFIRTEQARRTTGNTESRTLLAESLTEQVIGLAIEVHRNTGPGLLEAVYEQCLCVELRRAGVAFARQVPIPMLYKGEQVGDGFKADVVVAEQLILEIKSVTTILTVHEMQLRTYLRMSGIRVGLLLNFNAPRLTDGLRRYVV